MIPNLLNLVPRRHLTKIEDFSTYSPELVCCAHRGSEAGMASIISLPIATTASFRDASDEIVDTISVASN